MTPITVAPTFTASASSPTQPPPDSRPIVAHGHLPHFCTEADPNPNFQTTGALMGWSWSPLTSAWIPTPICVFRWGYIGLSAPSVLIEAGGVATFSLTDSDAAPFIPAHGGALWSTSETVVSGCGWTDVTCSVRVGVAGQPPVNFGYHPVHLSAPAAFITSPIGSWQHCSESTPCPYLQTNVWGMVVVRPAAPAPPPLPVATASPTGSTGEWRLDGSGSQAFDGNVIERWSWTIPGVGDREGRTVDAVIPRDQLPAAVRLEVEDDQGQVSSTTITVDESITIDQLTVTPDPLTVGGELGRLTMTVRNGGAWPLTDVNGSITTAAPALVRVDEQPAPVDLAPGASADLEFTVEAIRGGTAELLATASGRSGNRTLSDGPKQRNVTVEAPELQVAIAVDPAEPVAGEQFTLIIEVTNTGDTDLSDVQTAGAVSFPAGRSIDLGPPTPASIPTLASGASAEIRRPVTSEAGTATFEVTARGTDGVAGEVTSNTATLEVEIGGSLAVTSVVAERSGHSEISARGGEVVTVNGRGFDDVTTVGISRPGGDEEIVTIPVEPTNSSQLTFTAPNTVALLEFDGDGRMVLDAELYVYYEDPDEPGSYFASDDHPVAFVGPMISGVAGSGSTRRTASAKAGTQMEVDGSALLDVEGVAIFRAGTEELLGYGSNVVVHDNESLTFSTPDLTGFLEWYDDVLAIEVDVYAYYDDPEAADGVVVSNPSPFEFRGPTLESVSAYHSEGPTGSLFGGEEVIVAGTDLNDLDRLRLYRAGTDEVLVEVWADVSNEHQFMFTSPVLVDVMAPDDRGVQEVATEIVGLFRPDPESDELVELPGALAFVFRGPDIAEVTSTRTGMALTAANGGDTITVTGSGLADVDRVTLLRRDDDEIFEELDVVASSDTELIFVMPSVNRYLELGDDGTSRADAEVELSYDPARRRVRSNPLMLDVSGPTIDDVVADSTGEAVAGARGLDQITLHGDLLADVTGIAILRDGSLEALEVVDEVTVVDDTTVVARVPRMVSHLVGRTDGSMGVDTQVVAFYRDDRAIKTDGVVRTNARPLEITGPRLDSLTSDSGDDRVGPANGGARWLLDGNLREADWVKFLRSGTDTVLDSISLGGLGHDGLAEILVPAMAAHLLRGDDGIARAEVDIVVGYLAAESPTGEVRSNRIAYAFEGPSIWAMRVIGTPTLARAELAVDGQFLSTVSFAAIRDPDGSGRLIDVDHTIASDDSMTVTLQNLTPFMRARDDGSVVAVVEFVVGYEAGGAPDGRVTSNTVSIELESSSVVTVVTSAADAGATRLEIASNEGWSTGDYARIHAPGGPIDRRVQRIGSLVFDAPIPFAVPVGTVVERIAPPGADRTAPSVVAGRTVFDVGDVATVSYTCNDGTGVGVEQCVGSLASGARLDTSTAGIVDVTVTTWDRNGNLARVTIRYQVRATSGPVDPWTPTTTVVPAPPTSAPGASGPSPVRPVGTLPATGGSIHPIGQLTPAVLAFGLACLLISRRRPTRG